MIPLKLTLSGFLSYRDPVELDFTAIDLACIAGPNGAGKSSLLDAITWALFGQARKRDDSLINAQCEMAEVSLIFAYEGNIYRIQRTKPRDKTALLEFHILQESEISVSQERLSTSSSPIAIPNPATWKPLTERTLRETEASIQQTLRMDYETFVNASFFLQGKADQFTQQRPGDRKRILSSILGLDAWEGYRQRAAERRRKVESEIAIRDGLLREIDAELAEEQGRKAHLEVLQADLDRLSEARAAQESALENMRKISVTLEEQSKLVEALARQLEAAARQLDEMETRLATRREERESFGQVLSRAAGIQDAYRAWEEARAEVGRWEEVAARFREHEKRRQEPLDEINTVRAQLIQENQDLQDQQAQIEKSQSEINNLKSHIQLLKGSMKEVEEQLARREQLEGELASAHQSLAEARAENPRLMSEMKELKERIDQLESVEGATCPLCGQPLSPEERDRLIAELVTQGKEMGDRYRTNQGLLERSGQLVSDLEAQITGLSRAEKDLRGHQQALANFNSHLDVLENQQKAWDVQGAPRLIEIQRFLREESFAPEARARLAEIDAQLKAIGYDAAMHDAARRAETEGRAAEAELRALERAQATIAPLDREMAELQEQIEAQQVELARQQQEYDRSAAALASAQAQAPDLYAAERQMLDLQEQENRLRLEVGAAHQKVLVLEDLKARRKVLESERQELAMQVGRYKQLERALGKDGVPALLIEQALPQIESKANEILDRLSMGTMWVRFVTQAAYKDRRRDDLRETLEIQISDSAGTRDYEMFSIDGSEPVYIRKNGRILCKAIEDLWQEQKETRVDGEYEFQDAKFEALCYEDGKVAWLPVQGILRHPAPEEMLKLTFAPGGYSVKITSNHSIFLMTPDGLKIKRGDEVKPGDYVLTPRRIPDRQVQEPMDLIDRISPEFVAQMESAKKKIIWKEHRTWSRVDRPIDRYRPFVGGRLAAHKLSNLVGCESNQKQIPELIFNASRTAKISFLKGLIFGDGHTRMWQEKSEEKIGITTTSPKLVADTIFLCRQIGIWASIEKHSSARFYRGAEQQLSCRINIKDGANAGVLVDSPFLKYAAQSVFDGIPLDLVSTVRHSKQKRIKRVGGEELYPCGGRVVPRRSQEAYKKMVHWLEDWAVLEVSSVEETPPSSPFVYDLVVPDNHTFVAGSGLILVHNSGGEAFRVNFAIRLALSEVLAQRAGARLQTLVIDEGFGSQDAQGRQRLLEAINLVRQDFAKILVITHIDELKDAFPVRVEVEKTPRGSTVHVI